MTRDPRHARSATLVGTGVARTHDQAACTAGTAVTGAPSAAFSALRASSSVRRTSWARRRQLAVNTSTQSLVPELLLPGGVKARGPVFGNVPAAA